MAQHKVAYIASSEPTTDLVEQQLEGLDYELNVHVCASQGEAIEAIKGADVIINQGVPMPREVIEEIDTAKAIVSMGHGFNHIDHNAATDQGVMVVNTAGFVTGPVADHTIMMLLACANQLTRLHSMIRAGKWTAQTRLALSGIPNINGSVLGIVGLGNIGLATARRASAFGMEVIAYDRYVPGWTARDHGVELMDSLEELASRSDFVSILVPLNDETRKLIGASFFAAMKPAAYFINTCRGPTVDEAALIEALRRGQIAGAGLDVFEEEPTSPDNPLLKMDNVIVTPHTAGSSTDSTPDGLTRLGEEAARVLSGTWPMSLVNPEVRGRVEARPPARNR
jgi:D-3-phosphoglycerate dehydrogenase